MRSCRQSLITYNELYVFKVRGHPGDGDRRLSAGQQATRCGDQLPMEAAQASKGKILGSRSSPAALGHCLEECQSCLLCFLKEHQVPVHTRRHPSPGFCAHQPPPAGCLKAKWISSCSQLLISLLLVLFRLRSPSPLRPFLPRGARRTDGVAQLVRVACATPSLTAGIGCQRPLHFFSILRAGKSTPWQPLKSQLQTEGGQSGHARLRSYVLPIMPGLCRPNGQKNCDAPNP